MKKDIIWPCRVSSVILTIDAEGNYSLERMNPEGDVFVAFVTGEDVGCKDYDGTDAPDPGSSEKHSAPGVRRSAVWL